MVKVISYVINGVLTLLPAQKCFEGLDIICPSFIVFENIRLPVHKLMLNHRVRGQYQGTAVIYRLVISFQVRLIRPHT